MGEIKPCGTFRVLKRGRKSIFRSAERRVLEKGELNRGKAITTWGSVKPVVTALDRRGEEIQRVLEGSGEGLEKTYPTGGCEKGLFTTKKVQFSEGRSTLLGEKSPKGTT